MFYNLSCKCDAEIRDNRVQGGSIYEYDLHFTSDNYISLDDLVKALKESDARGVKIGNGFKY